MRYGRETFVGVTEGLRKRLYRTWGNADSETFVLYKHWSCAWPRNRNEEVAWEGHAASSSRFCALLQSSLSS